MMSHPVIVNICEGAAISASTKRWLEKFSKLHGQTVEISLTLRKSEEQSLVANEVHDNCGYVKHLSNQLAKGSRVLAQYQDHAYMMSLEEAYSKVSDKLLIYFQEHAVSPSEGSSLPSYDSSGYLYYKSSGTLRDIGFILYHKITLRSGQSSELEDVIIIIHDDRLDTGMFAELISYASRNRSHVYKLKLRSQDDFSIRKIW
jgi:hypothetical protein